MREGRRQFLKFAACGCGAALVGCTIPSTEEVLATGDKGLVMVRMDKNCTSCNYWWVRNKDAILRDHKGYRIILNNRTPEHQNVTIDGKSVQYAQRYATTCLV